jgi:hypothetical protein
VASARAGDSSERECVHVDTGVDKVKQLSALIAVSAFLIPVNLAHAQPSSAAEQSLKKFLQDYLKDPRLEDEKTTLYFDAFVDLNGDGKKEAVVYLMGREWCGSGGCITLILARDRVSWKIVGHITITRPPIRVLSSTSHGWHDIGVWVQGGGILPGYEAAISFDGKTYPGNPSVPPARRLSGRVAGKTVITSVEGGTPLYP